MIARLITWCLEHRATVLLLTAVLIGTGVQAVRELPIEAFPDTTPVMVEINTAAPSLTPEEMEQQVTFPIEQVLGGLPGLVNVRSVSKFGFSKVTAIFEDRVDLYLARQLVAERLTTVRLPEGIPRPRMGPISTGLGEIYHYVVRGDERWTLQELTTLHEWEVEPRLLSVPGVAEVNTWGGERKQFQVRVEPAALVEHGVTLDDLFVALRANNLNVGGGNVTQAGELMLVHGIGRTTTAEQIGDVTVAAHEGVPVRVRDLARVVEGHEIRRGAVTAEGEGEVVLGLAFLLKGENSHSVTSALEERMSEIRRSLPDGVRIETVYERTDLVDRVIATVKENLFEGALLVVAVLFAFLGNLRAGLIVALAIPLSMLFAFNAMLRLGIAGSLMSLGAIDFGLIVDSSVIQVENAVSRLGEASDGRSRLEVIRDAALEVRRPTLFGELIITVVYLPILTLEGIEGRMFIPMALTVILALAGSLVLSVTLMPVLASLVLPRGGGGAHGANRLTRAARALYAPVLRRVLRRGKVVLAGAVILLAGGAALASRLGSEFIPQLSEMSVVINTVRLSGVSIEESVRYGTRIERFLLEEYPDEIRDVWTRTGTAEVANDPMGIELSDVFITLTPRSEWTHGETQAELVADMSRRMSDFPGMRAVFTQPIEMRMNEMVAGIRTDVGVKIFGDDLGVLEDLAEEVAGVLEGVRGAADVYVEQVTGQPVLRIRVDRDALARHAVPARHVMEVVEALGGAQVGEVRQGQRRFPLVVRLPERFRGQPDAFRDLLVPSATGELFPLHRLTEIREERGASTITREWQRRRILVQCNVRGRDVGSFVHEVQDRLREDVELPGGYHIAYGGQFEHLQRARLRLMIVVPLALALIFVLLHTSTGSLRDSVYILTAAPLAALGGVLALWVRGMPFTISAGVGFIAVSGVAMLAGLVLASTIQRLRRQGTPLVEAVEQGALRRLRPVIMTGLVAGLGFVPMALNTGVGAEVQRPLATVVVGGIISANLLTLLVLPALYAVFGGGALPARPDEEANALPAPESAGDAWD